MYKARGLKLERFVALKVLPAGMVSDPERVRRFEQEAKTASALNHPNIVTIHDIAEQDGVRFIVMEFIKGQTLDRLIPKGGMARAQALGIAVQVADAVAAAAASGVTHRDLKPGNIMITDSGLVKLLDFGLAKLTERVAISADDATVVAAPKTKEGVIAGTVDYMSPEQAEGRAIDARSDIFSFGAVLYEMLSGGKPFAASTPMAVLGSIMHQEPKAITGLPEELNKLLTRAMRKDVDRRFQTMADLRAALLDCKEESQPKPPASSRRNWVLAAAAVALAAVALVLLIPQWRTQPAPNVELKAVPLTALAGLERQPAFSPDGNQIAFTWRKTPESRNAIHVRAVKGGPVVALTSSDQDEYCPQWSPDGQWIAFTRQDPANKTNAVFLVSPLSRQERRIVDTGSTSIACLQAWHPNGQWLAVGFAGKDHGLYAVSLESGQQHRIGPEADRSSSRPTFSPDGKWIAYSANGRLRLLAVDESLKPGGEGRTLLAGGAGLGGIAWMPDSKELLFSATADTSQLYRIAVEGGAPRQIMIPGLGDRFSTIAIGGSAMRLRLAVTNTEEHTSIVRQDLNAQGIGVGEPRRLFGTTRPENHPDWSPDGTRLAFVSGQTGQYEVWTADAEGGEMEQLTRSGIATEFVHWSPDGSRILRGLHGVLPKKSLQLVTLRTGAITEIQTKADASHALGWSGDGKSVYFTSHQEDSRGVWRIHLDGTREERVLEHEPHCGAETPDGKEYLFDWIGAIHSQPLSGGKPRRIADSGGMFSVARGGIFYFARPGRTNPEFHFRDWSGNDRVSFRFRGRLATRSRHIAVSADGRHAALVTSVLENSDLMLVENFR